MGKTLGYGEITVANMTEPFTVMLTNEAQQFATDSNRKVTSAQSYYTDIIVIRGSQERTDYTIGNITSGSGITVSKNSKRVTFSVSAGNVIGADTGVIEIPITLDGQTVNKTFSWSLGKQGIQGVKGIDGDSFAWNMLSHSSMIGEKIVCQYIEPCNSVITYQYTDEGYHIVTPSSGNANNGIVIRFDNYKDLGIDDGESISFSCDIKGSTSSKPCIAIRMGDNLWYGNDVVGKSATFTPTNNWQRFSVSTTTPSNLTKRHIWLAIHGNLQSDLYIKNLKLEKGISATPWSPSQSDIEGKGIAQTVQYYLATSQASGVTSSTSGWSTDITTQKITATKKYLWNCSQTRYTDGTSEPITTPTIIGAYGDKGETGADGQDGAGFHWNLLKYSGDLSQMSYGKVGGYIDTQEFISDASTPSKNVLKSTITTVGNGIYIQGKYLKKEAIKKGNTYTVSAWCKCSSAKDIGVMNVEFLDKKVNISMPKLSTEWQQYIITGVANKDVTTTSGGSAISFYYGNKMAVGDILYISSPKVEEGDKASPWCTTYEETLAKNLSITPSAQIFKSTDGGNTFAPNQITITPALQGEISFGKWQYSIDGGVSFADVVSGQKGLTISNNVLTVSKDSSLYSDAVTMVTFRAVASDSSFYDTCSIAKIYDVSDIGDGRNLWITRDNITLQACEKDKYIYTTTGTSAVCIGADAASVGTNTIALQTGTKYTISFVISSPSEVGNALWYFCTALNSTGVKNYGGYGVKLVTGENIVSQTITVDTSCDAAGLVLYHLPTGCVIKDIQVEKGSSPTGWTPAPEDVQTAILSTKSEISDVSLKVDKNKQAIEQRVEKTTYQQDLNLVKGDISKANEGLNKWRYEIYPKSLFASEYQGKSTMDVFAKNTNLTPSQSVLINDTDLSIAWNYDNNYIGYALTFAKFSAAKSVAITFAHDDGAHIYLNGKLIGGSDAYNNKGESLTLGFVKGWNCIEVVVNEGASTEGFKLGTTISAISECQLMNCYYGTPVARQSHITNQLVENTTNIKGVTTTMQKVMTTVGGSDRIDEFVNNYNKTIESEKQFKKTIGETYTTKDEFNGLEIGGRNLLTKDDCNMSKWQNLYPVHCKVTNNDYSNHIDYVPTSGEWEIVYKKISITKGQKYILSFDYKVNKAYNYLSGQKYGVYLSTSIPTNAAPINIITDGQYVIENTVTSLKRGVITFTATVDTLYIVINGGCINDNQTGLSFEFNRWKLEKGNKATDWTPATEDDEINGQNLVSNLPSNWEQGSFQDSNTNVGCDYDTNKVSMTTRIRVKELVPVSGTITISNAYSNQSKKPIQHWITAFDINKKWLGASYVSTAWSDFPRIVDMKDAKYIAVIVKYKDESAITPSDISQICLKIERGTSATPFTLAPEDVNGKIVNVETIANQTAKKFEWIVKGGDKSSSMVLTDDFLSIVANKINLKGKVTFESLSSDAKNEIGKVAQSKVDNLNIGGRNLIINSNLSRTLTNVTNDGCSNMTVVSDSVYGHALKFTAVNQRRVFWATSNVWVKDKTYTVSFVAKSSVTGQKIRPSRSIADWGDDITLTTSYARYTTKITSLDTNAGGTLSFSCTNAVGDITITNVKLEVGNKATDWTPAPEDVSQDATNKASQALTDAKNYSSNAVNWVTNNGSSTTSLNSMVKKWTDGAVSDTAQINGGWIKANTITASKIALADFTNYSQLTRDTADAYGFTVTDDTDGTWFSTKNIKRDQFISEIFPCNGGESYLIEYDISTNAKGANNSTDTKNYIGVAIGVYGYTGTVGSNGLPNKATNIWYADRITGSETAPSIHVKTTITTSTATKQFRVFLQSNGYYFEGTTKIRNLSVRRMYGGTLIVDGSITADKIATDAIKSRNYISSGGTQGSFLNLSDGSFQSPNLSWDSNGNLIAKNANLSGEITATKGTIGGWSIISNSFFTKYNSSIDSYGTGISGDNNRYVLWAGEKNNAYGVNRNSDTPTDATLRIWRNGAIEIQGNDSTTSGIGHLYKILIQAGRIKVGIDDHYIGSICGSDTTLDNQVINQHVSLTAHKGYGWSILHTNDSGNLICDIKRDPNTNGIKFFDGLLISSGGNQIQLNANNQGSIELYGNTPFIDFHCGYSDADYTSRIIANGSNSLNITGNLWVDTDIHAGSWLYASEVHSGGAVVIASNSESYYWAHGYQMARGTSWGGVCIGDDSQGLRLYGTSIWASHSISTSDENLKENFTTLDQYEDFYMNLNPIGFNYIGDYDGKKTHFGFGAHKTEDILESEGYDSDKFAVVTHRPLVQEDIEKRFGKDVEVDIETEYGVSYTEFIALNTHMIQKTRKELAKVKQEKADLEARLQVIEAKLGL